MKTLILTLTLSLFVTFAFTQTPSEGAGSQTAVGIKVPDFADPEVKSFYQAYADHLIKCIQAIREKDEAKVTALFKDPGEQLVAREKTLNKELVKNSVENQKYMQFAKEAYPYIKEVERSVYYQKMYGNKK
jgi:hypothetical protein